MTKSLGDYNIEKSSSSNVNNINWSQKKQNDNKPKKKKVIKKSQIPSGTNIIYKKDNEEEKVVIKKIFKIEDEDVDKSKEKVGKRYENTSVTKGSIKEKSFKRPGR